MARKQSAPAPRAGAPAQGRELRARGQKTVRRLLDAGTKVFSQKGYHAARVDDIVKAAKTSHGTFYLYFANKEDLFRALAADVADEVRTLTDSLAPLTPDEAGLAELRAWLMRFASMYEQYGAVIKAWTEAEVDGSGAGRLGTSVLGQLTTGLASRIASSPAHGIDPTVGALAFVALFERTHYYLLAGQLQTDRETLSDTLARVAFAALFGAPASTNRDPRS